MAYGLNPRLFIENGPAIEAARAQARSSSNAYRAWRGLDREHRLSLVEGALRTPANDDSPDGFPLAL